MPTVAFLGPQGSYSELALKVYDSKATGVPCLSIAEVFKKLSQGDAELGIVPIENMIEGPITETLDYLFENRNAIFIQTSLNYRIRNCLGSLSNSLDSITHVYSKDVALRQCSKFISSNLINAAICPSSSSGAAAELVAKSNDPTLAAIAAEETLTSNGLKVLAADISDLANNQTRFLILSKDKKNISKKSNSGVFVTSLVVSPGKDRQGLLFEILEVISIKHKINLRSIHSRPDGKGGFVFHLDLQGSEESLEPCIKDLRDYCFEFTGGTAAIHVIGSYPQIPFEASINSPVGIIGGAGKMGLWFTKFFNSLGIEVLVNDPAAKHSVSVKKLCEDCEIIILSVPMSKADGIIKQLVQEVKKGTLIVENFSVKEPWLTQLNDLAPKHVEVLGIHTMFGGDIEQLRTQNVIVTRASKSGEKAGIFEDLLYKHGAQVSHFNNNDHDKTTAFLQSLIQFILIGFANTIADSFENAEQIEAFHTPNSSAVFGALRKILNLGDELIADMQLSNLQNIETRKKLIETLKILNQALESKDLETIKNFTKKARNFAQIT